MAIKKGICKCYFVEKSYGFIETETGADIFFHRSGILGDIPVKHDHVTYEDGTNKKTGKPIAINVRVV